MTGYLDTSALVKLLHRESESSALLDWLGRRNGQPIATSVVGIVELARVASRLAAPVAGRQIAERLTQISLTSEIATLAGQLRPPTVRTLDAIHVASAAVLTDLTALVTYDDRMITAAEALGLPVTSPGR